MSSPHKLAVTLAYILVLGSIGATDAYLTRDRIVIPARTPTPDSGSASSADGIEKNSGANVFETLSRFNLATQTTREESLLRRIIPSDVIVESRVLLRGNDRIAFFSWVESPDVKSYAIALKEALHASFSDDLQDLVDEVQEDPELPTRDVLTFLDPAIHEDRLLFVRVRQRLYEFHIAPGREPEVQELLDALTE